MPITTFDLIQRYHEALLGGLAVTLKMVGVIWGVGLLAGTALGVSGARWPFWFGFPTRFCSFLIGAIPLIALLFFLHYPLQAKLSITIDPIITVAATLSVFNTLAIADTIRPAIRSFPRELYTVSRITGLTYWRFLVHIQFPIVLRQVLPTLLMLQVTMLQSTVFGAFIGAPEIFRVAQRIDSVEHMPIEAYGAVAVFFLLVCLPVNGLALALQRGFQRDLSEK